ncbi:putative cell division-associated protein bimb [Erysiphe necator]|uniref:separase n=1 Tax=Uncinula necator TaxID=52586 RepID=A0A0B1PB34_UNCNE|nr:putative cell division-associated protein bimb [Erysiphe necator]
MESFDEKVLFFSNAVKKATPAIVITLGELLSTNKSQQTAKLSKSNYTPRINNRSYEGTSRAKKPVNKTASRKDDGKLSYQEKSLLSTEIINVTLKSLSEALKPLKSVTTLRPNSTELIQQEGDNTNSSSSISELTFHSRSSSTRKSSSSNISNKETRTSISALSYESEYKPTAECARIAFSCLRELQSSKSLDLKLPHLHLEHGMSVLITKLISLGMDDLAVKELRILKRCLTIDLKNTKVDIKPLVSCGSNLANLLDFGNIELCGLKLELVITTQLQVLRLIASSKKPKNAELALPILSLTNTSSPIRLIQIAAKGVQEVKKIDKLTRQLQSVTEIILSLCPSVSPSYDALAVESRISLCPKIAIQLQTIALYSRILWWDLARHTGDFSKDILKPFLFCLSAFARRSQNSSSETLYIALEAMKTIHKQVENFPIPSLPAVNSVMVDIFKLLASLAKDAHQIDVAISWIEQAYCILKKENILGARLYGIVARLVTLRLQSSSQDPIVEEQLFALLENLDRSLKGQASEIDDLFIEVSRTRKVALNYLINPPIRPESVPENNSLQEMCRSLVFLCPRLSLRYLGNVPEATATLKDVAQYKKRLQFIYKFSIYAVDSSLYLIKSLLAEGTLKWEFLDFRLQDCLTLLDQIDSQSNEASHHIGQGISPLTHRLRISNLYYSQYLDIRENRSPKTSNQMIKLLCRSIDCIRERPPQERKTALFTAKLERLAELYHNSGQYDELLQHLYTLRNELIQGGVLSAVLSQASSQPLKTAWSSSREISMLGRTIYSILKIQIKLAKSVSQLPLFEETWSNEERAIVLEYELEFLCRYSIAKSNSTIELQRFAFKQLLELYNKSQFPLRRFRVILRFLIAQFGSFDKQFYEAEMELESSIIENLVIQGTEDDGLSKYFIYFKSIAMISKEFNKNQPCLTKLTRGLTILSEILSKCKNLSDLNKQIDDIVALLALLNTINDWLQVHGHDKTRISVLNLITELSEKAEVVLSHDELILNLIKLGTQWLHLGYSGKACQALDRARNFHQKTGSSTLVTLQLQIFASEYFLTIGNLNEVEANLSYTHSIFTKAKEHMIFPKVNSSINQKLNTNLLISSAYTINSKFAFERGLVYPALSYAKQSVRLLRSAWADIEGHTKKQNHVLDKTPSEIERLAGEISNISLSTPSQKLDSVIDSCEDYTSFWAILIPLFRSLNDLSTTYAHHGMFQETIYYAEQAYKLVKQVRSNNYIAISGITLGNIWLRAGNLSKGSELLSEAKLLLSSEVSKEKVLLSYNLGIMNGLLCNFDAEINFYGNAINNLNELLQKEYISSIETFLKPIENYEKKLPNSCETKQKHPQRKLRSNNKSATKINLTTPVRAHFDGISSITNEYPFLLALRSQIIREKSRAFLHQKRWTDASNLLLETETSFSSSDKVGYGLAIGKYLLTQSLSQMDADPVYSILQDSTISFPSVLGSSRFFKNGDKLSAAIVSPKKCVGTRIGTERTNNKISSSDSFFDKLRRAQDYLRETLSIAMVVSPVSIIYKTTHLLNSVAILLSTADQIKAKSSTHPCLSSLLIETARNLAQQRERKAIQIDPLLKISSNGFCWPQPNLLESKKPSYGFQDDSIAKFEREYIDIIPKLWTVISISLSDSRHELSLIKLQAGSSPFILQLPLGRNSSIDADEEAFNYEQGRAELQEIIRLANESAHDAGNRLGREARISWWNERETLDIRMKDLLKNIEKVWLGGFKGIFSQQIRRADLFARFQKTFQGILDKYLPSRRKGSKRNCVNRITLDSRIFDLFIGLGDMFEEVLDLSEPLTDLLYFVVDILQFHGEFNAYAEIDFDMIVLETTDALRCYHEAIRGTQKVDEGRHTILILDKNLHSFPWESLPCLDGLAVSRLPSLESLRERLIPRPEKSDTSNLDGFFIDRSLGSYVLNPGGDLKHTLRIFKKELQALQGWNGIINREPSEEEFKNNLSNSDLFLYFGHGSGSQYIRAREIQKLSKCAVTILMGCSSGALIETGEFEPYGPPVNYLHAGCHALVATLWDVTDKDIDRFAKRTFENWGLFNSRPELKLDSNGKGKNKNFDEPVITKMPSLSLTEAVAMSRRACNLRYLNAAAVCVYGVPVYFKE